VSAEGSLLFDRTTIAALLQRSEQLALEIGRPVTLMEVCGTHTHAVAAAGLRRLLPQGVRLISGPGCPVCVTPVGYLDRALALAGRPDTVIATFGDLMRVPSSTLTLEQGRAEGKRIAIVYSPRDAVAVAKDNPMKTVIFLAVGFETTAPTIAAALAEAEASGLTNFLILPGNKLIPPPMRALIEDPQLAVDGFLLPGHVSVITGSAAFNFLAADHGVGGAVAGFTPADVMRAVVALLEQLAYGQPSVVNLYERVVTAEGNRAAWSLIDRFFTAESSSWRGFGEIPASGLGLRPEWAHRDASTIPVEVPPPHEPAGCRCGDVLRGLIDPPQCNLYASSCTPGSPAGACMVSSEGTCAAWYRHERTTAAGARP
jgi:hydrogenase expression/formation protein HypD